jgi:hypothetical protein
MTGFLLEGSLLTGVFYDILLFAFVSRSRFGFVGTCLSDGGAFHLPEESEICGCAWVK